MHFPLVTKELIGRLSNCDPDYRDDRMRLLQALPGNPAGIEFHHFDHVQATISNSGYFDTIRGLDIGDEDRLDAAMSLYRGRGIKLQLGLYAIPVFFNAAMARRFVAHGFYQADFHTVVYGIPLPLSEQTEAPHIAPGVTVEAVDAENINLFTTVLCEGFEMAPDGPTAITAPASLSLPNWRLYLARVNGVPAAAAIMTISNGVGSLAAGATTPAFRRLGCQAALIRQRIADAHAMGCDLIRGAGAVDSSSQHNQERAGLRIAYTYAKWNELDI